jgi:hypothetical protein
MDMIENIVAFVINLLIVDPVQNELNKRLAEARAP